MDKVVISTINFNNSQITQKCLDSINKLKTSDFDLEVVVIDNGTKDRIVIKKGNRSKVKVIYSDRNLGFSGGHNLGIKYALSKNADYIFILNNDTTLDENSLLELLKVMRANKSIGMTSPKIYFAEGSEYYKDKYPKNQLGKIIWYAGSIMDWDNVIASHKGVDKFDNGTFNKIEETESATGCAMLIKSEVVKELGGFDDNYFLYYEDNDLSQRAKKRGFKIFYVSKSIIWHKNAASTGGSGSNLQDYYITRNRLLFGMKYAPFRSKIALIKESFRLYIKGRMWQKKGVVDFYLRKFGKGSYG